MVLFLDYDGVLHPDAVYLVRGKPELRAEGELFMWAPLLEAALRPHPQVRIVLSTSWVRVFNNFTRARDFLPSGLRSRTIGATWHSGMARHHEGSHRVDATWYLGLSRYEQIARYASRAGLRDENWLAIDDDNRDWPAGLKARLVETEGATGISSPTALLKLRSLLGEMPESVFLAG